MPHDAPLDLQRAGVQLRQGRTKAHIDRVRGGVPTQVVRVIKNGLRCHGRRLAVCKGLHTAARAVGNDHSFGRWQVEHALRLVQPLDPVHALAGAQVDHLKRVRAQRRDEEASAFDVKGEMVDAPLDSRQLDPARQRQRLGWRHCASEGQRGQRHTSAQMLNPRRLKG